MFSFKPWLSLFLVALIASVAVADRVIIIEKQAPAQPAPPAQPDPGQRPLIQLALLLDTSNSMDGLINQARTQLWTIVNELAATRRDGKVPELQVALYQYGNDSLPITEGYIRQMVPFTTDLDVVSRELFALTTNGGSEYCGQVIDTCVKELDWSRRDDVYKVIFIAGNEPFTQGQTPYAEAISAARERRIVVNTIHCGGEQTGLRGMWRHGAALGGGEFFNIDQDRQIVFIKSPYDERIRELNVELNNTYIWYGDRGREAQQNQISQDAANAMLNKAAAMERAKTKANSHVYKNADADLVDASQREGFKLDDVDEEALPEPMKTMNPQEREAYIKQKAQRRAEVQQEIQKLSQQRDAYVAEQRQKQAPMDEQDTLGEAVKRAARTQAEKHGFEPAAESVESAESVE